MQRTTNNFKRRLGVAIFTLSVSLGTQLAEAGNSSAETLKNEIKQLADDISALTRDKTCQTGQNCAVIGIGHRPCGGPSQYLVFSKLKTDEAKLIQLASQHRDAHRKLNQLLGLMSTCEFLPEPPVACVNQQCAVATH